ncbi:MAG: hypothetical protein JSV90_07290 [Methanobacteriota archaeon]|nr:MAG: hypothetical protein JSV90_07290 [Euryarchaeota archaeon]
MTDHSTCKGSKAARRLCPICLHWDARPEDGSGPGIGYCSERDIITLARCECEYFEELTEEKVEARNRALYGGYKDESEDEEEE